jgi:hypothetical protein
MTDYHVVPGALRKSVTKLDEASDKWVATNNAIKDRFMDADTLGLLGRTQQAHDAYNRALQTVTKRLTEGAERLKNAADTLNNVAKTYEATDVSVYRKYGYIDEKVGH